MYFVVIAAAIQAAIEATAEVNRAYEREFKKQFGDAFDDGYRQEYISQSPHEAGQSVGDRSPEGWQIGQDVQGFRTRSED